MKSGLRLTTTFAVILGVMLIVTACSPMPGVIPGGQTPTASVFLPGVEQPGIATSPLKPTATIMETTTLMPAIAVSPLETPQPALVGQVWQWGSSTFKDGTVLAPGDPSRYTFELLPDGNAMVQADCNFGTATYQETDAGFTFGPIGTTKMACPPDSLDSEFLGQLRNIERYELSDDGLALYLLEEAGVMQFGAGEAAPLPEAPSTPVVPAASPTAPPTPVPQVAPPTVAPTVVPQLASPTVAPATSVPVEATPQSVQTTDLDGTSWVLASLWVNGQEMPLVAESPVTLEVTAGGTRINGSAGCNQYRAMLTTDASDTAVTAPALMTRKTCPANLMSQEVEFIDALLRSRAYEMSGDELTLLDSDNETLMVFVKR